MWKYELTVNEYDLKLNQCQSNINKSESEWIQCQLT